MALKGYTEARELVMSEEAKQAFQTGFQKIKDAILSYGFDKTAVDNLKFTVTEHAMTISEDSRKSGAWHVYADGKPFYALTVTAPGSFMDSLVGKEVTPLTKRAPQQQSIALALEIGMNLLPKMEQVLTEYFNVSNKEGSLTGSVSTQADGCEIETTLRCDPVVYCHALGEIIKLRLKHLLPNVAPKKGAKFNPN